MNTNRIGRLTVIPASVALALGVWTGTAGANLNTVDASCVGLTFNMPRGETGTTVTTSLDGQVVRTDTIATFGASLAYTLVSPERGTPHSWVVVIDSVYNEDQTIVRNVAACDTPATTTIPASTTTTTTPPVVATSTIPPTSTTVPPAGTTSTVPATSTTVPTTVPSLPATGADMTLPALFAATSVAFGFLFARLARRGTR